MNASTRAVVLVALGVITASVAALAAAADYGPWSPAARVEATPGTDPSFNGPATDGCPFVSRDGKTFYMASNRPGGLGGLDIWMAMRERADDPWGAPTNLGAPINSAADDFCPTIARDGHLFFFVSTRRGGCGGADIYTSRVRDDHGWDRPTHLGCEVNSSTDEASPFTLPERAEGPVLYFSSLRTGNGDIYVSESHGGVFGPAGLVPGVNTAAADLRPNLRRDGLELFFESTRPGGLGGADLYAATRGTTLEPWSIPTNLGPNVNSAAAETRPSLSWDGTTLFFGSTRAGGEGASDHYVTTRDRFTGP